MKKFLFMALAIFATLTACNNQQANMASNERIDSLQAIIAERDTEINGMMENFNDIQEGFQAINAAQNRVTVARLGERANRTQVIRENIKLISETMQQNRERIKELQAQLAKSSFKGTALQKTIENLQGQLEEKNKELESLRAELAQKNIHIAQLDSTITDLHTNVNNLTTETQQKSETISQQDKQLHTGYVLFGTKQELKQKRIWVDGKILRNTFNHSYFERIDIRERLEFKLSSTYAKLLTTHPSSSYTLVRDANKQYTLRITNPDEFWSTSKFLVVRTKN